MSPRPGRSTSTPARRGTAVVVVLVVLLGVGALLLERGNPVQTGTPAARASASATRTATTRAPASRAPSTSADRDPESGLPYVEVADLPSQARTTIAAIEAGGPFPYAKDGATFGNLEGVLPRRPRGYYREYTVRTPGESDRGARRIVSGDHDRQLFWTADHYATFARVRR